MVKLYILNIIVFQVLLLVSGFNPEYDKIRKMNVVNKLDYYGYPWQTYQVTTNDGYILTVFRITGPRYKNEINKNSSFEPVILCHGILTLSNDYILAGPQKSLGLMLADNGYDVWLPNLRGATDSQNHTRYNSNEFNSKYWDFSYNELGQYDIPTIIDFVLAKTGKEQLSFIGHSQGSTAAYVMLSGKPEYNTKLKVQISLAPIGFMKNIKSPIVRLLKGLSEYVELIRINVQFFKLNVEAIKMFLNSICGQSLAFLKVCAHIIIYTVVGYNEPEMNYNLLWIYLYTYPQATSTKSLLHYLKGVEHGRFCDYECKTDYNLTNIEAPSHFFYSSNDYLSAPEDVKTLYRKISSRNKYLHLIKDPLWNHIDYFVAKDAEKLVYDKILDVLKKYNV